MIEHVSKLKSKPLSWSAISAFEYNKKTWAKRYLDGIKDPSSREMEFGSYVGNKLAEDKDFLPQIIRHDTMEYKFHVKIHDIELVGYADTFDSTTCKKLGEYKTAKIGSGWTNKKVDNHGQITMYCLMNFIQNKVPPEEVEIELTWMPTQENGDFTISFIEPIEQNIQTFKTKRTTAEILKFAKYIKKVFKEMEDFALKYDPTSVDIFVDDSF